MASCLVENLTCSVCLSIYEDPLVLSCSHSFCAACLRICWQDRPPGQRECPLCRRKISRDPPPNLALRNVCEAFLQAAAASDRQAADASNQQAAAASGQQGAATSNQQAAAASGQQEVACSVTEGIKQLTKDLTKNLLQLQERLKGLVQTEAQCEAADKFLYTQVGRTEELIKKQFEQLRLVLQEQEKSRLRAVKAEEKQRRSLLKDKIEAVREQKATVAKIISDTMRRLQVLPKKPPGLSMLRRYSSLVDLTQRPLQEEELQLGSGVLLDQVKHLGNLDFHIWSSLRPKVGFCPVVLDPNTAASDLSVSSDLRSLSQQGAPRLPLNAERLCGSYWAVLGAEGLSTGVHSWDVVVSGSRYWAVGLASRCERLPGVLSELWTVSRSSEGLQAGTLSGRPTALSLAQMPRTVRVVLDMDHRDLSFFAPDSTSLLHSFTLPPTGGTLFPYFFTGDHGLLQLVPQRVQVSVGPSSP